MVHQLSLPSVEVLPEGYQLIAPNIKSITLVFANILWFNSYL
jgi:hypothetical protein